MNRSGVLSRSNREIVLFRVLVVEDENLVRMVAMELVEEAGFQALEAANADEAIETLERTGAVDILLTDVRMPGSMDGLRLVSIVRRRWPYTKIIVASGHGGLEEAEAAGADRFFRKPFAAQALIGTLQEMGIST